MRAGPRRSRAVGDRSQAQVAGAESRLDAPAIAVAHSRSSRAAGIRKTIADQTHVIGSKRSRHFAFVPKADLGQERYIRNRESDGLTRFCAIAGSYDKNRWRTWGAWVGSGAEPIPHRCRTLLQAIPYKGRGC